jgi:hypothetical protein
MTNRARCDLGGIWGGFKTAAGCLCSLQVRTAQSTPYSPPHSKSQTLGLMLPSGCLPTPQALSYILESRKAQPERISELASDGNQSRALEPNPRLSSELK